MIIVSYIPCHSKGQYEQLMASFLKQSHFCGKSWRRFKQFGQFSLLKMYMQNNLDHDSIHRNHQFSHDSRFFHLSFGYYYRNRFISFYSLIISPFSLSMYIYIYIFRRRRKKKSIRFPGDIKHIFQRSKITFRRGKNLLNAIHTILTSKIASRLKQHSSAT